MSRLVVDREHFGNLFEVLAAAGYTVVAPTLGDNAIDYAVVTSVADLPIGWTADQEAGTYRLRRRGDEALFGYAVGPQSWKRYLFPPRTTLFRVRREQGSVTFVTDQAPPARYAFVGVRACELAAIAVQDRVFLGARPDRTYHDARRDLFTVGVNCAVAGGTCFCVSMGTGPRCTTGYDLVLTEVVAPDRHEFVFESATEAGDRVLDALPGRPATPADLEAVDRVVAATAASMGRTMDTGGIEGLLPANAGHPRWDEVADRCLACTNCTLVCPTCFCSTTEDAVSLDGAEATRSRRWDSCFSLDFSAVHGVPVRQSTKARYRQWLTHKLSTWHDQFGTSGCVGCGRCITWCPVGIDITEEVAAIRSTPGGTS